MSLYTAIKDFLHYLTLKGYSPVTIKNHHYHIRAFALYLEEKGIDCLAAVTPAHLRDYQAEMFWRISERGRPYSLSTHCARLCSLKRFFHYTTEKQPMTTDPTKCFKAKKPDRLPRNILSIEEVETILSQPNAKTFAGKRDRAIIEILYSTGVRHRELSELTLLDVSLSEETLSIRQGKGSKDRVVPLGRAAARYLGIYLKAREKVSSCGPALFITAYGEKLDYHTYNPILHKYAVLAMIEKPVTCHAMRHTCAVHMLEGGADVRSISELLGHESIESTQIYLRVSQAELKKVHKKAHPRGKAQKHGE